MQTIAPNQDHKSYVYLVQIRKAGKEFLLQGEFLLQRCSMTPPAEGLAGKYFIKLGRQQCVRHHWESMGYRVRTPMESHSATKMSVCTTLSR